MARWKLIEKKLKNLSKDITFEEMVILLEHYGYVRDNKGKTSGSRIKFTSDIYHDIVIHKPHPQKELKEYMIKDIHNIIEQEEIWNG